MQLHRKNGRRPANLGNIVSDYNAMASAEFKVELSELYRFKDGCVSDQLLEMIKANRRLPTYQLWKNPLRNPVIMAAEGGQNYTESEEDNDV